MSPEIPGGARNDPFDDKERFALPQKLEALRIDLQDVLRAPNKTVRQTLSVAIEFVSDFCEAFPSVKNAVKDLFLVEVLEYASTRPEVEAEAVWVGLNHKEKNKDRKVRARDLLAPLLMLVVAHSEKGDRDAWALLGPACYDLALRYTDHWAPGTEIAKDAAVEAMLKLFDCFDKGKVSFLSPGRLRSWIYKTAKNALHDEFRHGARFDYPGEFDLEDHRESHAEITARQIDLERILKVIGELKNKNSGRALLMLILGERTYREIAESLEKAPLKKTGLEAPGSQPLTSVDPNTRKSISPKSVGKIIDNAKKEIRKILGITVKTHPRKREREHGEPGAVPPTTQAGDS